MRLEQFIYLTEVIQQKNMHAASQSLYTSVQNISKSIKNLEAELGVPLLYRTKHGFAPTGDGKIVYEKALQVRQCVESLQEMYISPQPAALNRSGVHTITIASVCSMTIRLRHIIAELTEQEPSLAFSLYEYEGNALNKILQNTSAQESDYDFFFLASGDKSLQFYVPLLKDYDIYVLCSDYLGLSINSSHPLAKEKSIALAALNYVPLASFQTSVNEPSLFFSVLKENDFQHIHKPRYITNLHTVCNDYVEQNKAAVIACVPDKEWEELSLTAKCSRVVIPFKESIKIVHLMAFAKNRPLTPEAAFFKKTILDFFSDTYYRFTD